MIRELADRLKEVFTDEDDEASVWAPVPRWQYLGRLVEAGGITRLEEEAIQEVEEQAREIEDEVNR